MDVSIYCFEKGIFIKNKFIKVLKNEIENEFGKLKLDKYLHSDMLMCKIDKSYNSYFGVYEECDDLDRIINVLMKVSDIHELYLSCRLNKCDEHECNLLNYIKEKVKYKNIKVVGSINI